MSTATVDAAPRAREPTAPSSPGPMPPADVAPDAVRLAAWVSITAGAIHAIATVDHFSHYWLYGAVFLVFTYGQVLWGIAVLRGRVGPRGLAAAALANLAILAIWVFSRTIVVPLGPEAGTTEAVGTMDVAVALDEIVLLAYIAAILRPDLRARRALRVLLGVHRVRLGVALCSVTFFAAMLGGHSH